jgi:hypothetical protein
MHTFPEPKKPDNTVIGMGLPDDLAVQAAIKETCNRNTTSALEGMFTILMYKK